MSKKDLIQEKWNKDYKDKKLDKDTKDIIDATLKEWKVWVGKINDTEKPLQWFDLDMKNCSNKQPRPAKPSRGEKDEEKKKAYREWQYKNQLANYINKSMRPKIFGSWLVDQAGFLCGGSVQFSCAFGVWTEFDVEASFENIKSNEKYDENKVYTEKDFEDLLKEIIASDADTLVKKANNKDDDEISIDDAKNKAEESLEKLRGLIEAKTITEMEVRERDGFLSKGMRHKILMLQSISDTNVSCDYYHRLLFKNDIGNNVLDWFTSNGNKPKNNWVTRSVLVIDEMLKLLSIDKTQCDISIIRNIGSLVWNLNLDEEFAGIDDENYKQIVYTGAPGTGKTYGITDYVESACIKNPYDEKTKKAMEREIDQFKFVQFHSSYDYSDFVEGLRPVQLQEGQNPTFVRMDGVFKKFCRNIVEYNNKYNEIYESEIKDVNAPRKRAEDTTSFYFIIDEINRADLGKVFGELMYGLEESYRGKDHAFETQYSNLATYCENPLYSIDRYSGRFDPSKEDKYIPIKKVKEDVFEKGFYIPENLRIIGSMNDIDRSVETFDFALRRRFQWKAVSANDKDKLDRVLESMFDKNDAPDAAYSKKDELVKRIMSINKVISGEDRSVVINGSGFGLNEAYQIGPAYFKSFNGYFTKTDAPKNEKGCCLEVIWDEKIETTLREYVRGRMSDQIEEFIKNCRDKLIVELMDNENADVNGSEEDNESVEPEISAG